MPSTYCSIHVHAVWSTKNRIGVRHPERRDYLTTIIRSTARDKNAVVEALFLRPDHVHLLLSLPVNESISNIIGHIKRKSSRSYSEKYKEAFCWQSGYGAFSVGHHEKDKVKSYIAKQDEHHRVLSFHEELKRILIECHVPFNEEFFY